MFEGLAPARRRLLTALLAVAVVAVVAVAAVVAVKAGDDVTPAAQGDTGPVLLVPGYGGTTTGLEVLADALRADGREVTVVHLAGDGKGDLGEQADVLDAAAADALDETGADSVDVVGYSAGGVIARLWVSGDGAELARRVITLGSPHHGTDLAGLAGAFTPDECPEACVQLEPGSDLIRRLNAGDETPPGPQWVSIWTTEDEVVVPPQSAELDGAVNFSVQSVCAGSTVTHGGLPSDPDVMRLVAFELDAAETAVPSTRACA